MRLVPYSISVVLLLAPAGLTQTAGTASISGNVVSTTGSPLRALVALSPTSAGAARQGFTNLNGAFSFNQLSAGDYVLCARVPAEQSPSPDRPYLDTCAWPQPQTPVQLAAGQSLTGVEVAVPQGVLL